jgi:hypothetical protein
MGFNSELKGLNENVENIKNGRPKSDLRFLHWETGGLGANGVSCSRDGTFLGP